LLDAARELFAERGYARATVRDIAARAGANQALLFRYFGSKDELFRAAIAERGRKVLAEGSADTLPARLLSRLLAPDADAAQGQWLLATVRSSGHDEGASAIQEELGEEFRRALSALTDAPDAELRADLVLAWLLGIVLMRSVYHRQPLAGADPAAVADHVLRGARQLLAGVDMNFPPP
jgi:AcrR family transcriptional regulator